MTRRHDGRPGLLPGQGRGAGRTADAPADPTGSRPTVGPAASATSVPAASARGARRQDPVESPAGSASSSPSSSRFAAAPTMLGSGLPTTSSSLSV